MSARQLDGGGLCYEDVSVGDFIHTGACIVDAVKIDDFAKLTGDYFEVHMDDAAALRHGFPARVAHGLLVLALTDGLKNQAEARFEAIASLGWNWRFDRAVLIDDRISATLTIAGKRITKRPGRGILTLQFSVRNQHGETVQSGNNELMVYRRHT